MICDEFGNATAVEENIDYVDGKPPMMFLTETLEAPEGEFHYQYLVTDDRPIKAGRLYVTQTTKDGAVTAQGEVTLLYDTKTA